MFNTSITTQKPSQWYKLLSRGGVDITTTSQIDVVFYDLIQQVTGKKEESFFTILNDRNLTHYMNVDPGKIGQYSYKKFFNNPKQIIKYYNEGKILLKNINKDTIKWSKLLSPKSTNKELLTAFKNFRTSFKKICYIYSIISWIGIEAWQNEFENILNKLITKNNLEKQREPILTAIYKPWKKTALIEIQEKLAKGEDPKNLVNEYQFLRNWAVVWYKPITEEWVRSIQNSSIRYKAKKYSRKKLIDLLQPNRQEIKFIEMSPYIVFFKDWRDDVRRFHSYHWSFLFDLLEQKFNIPRDDIGYLTIDEIEEALQKNITDTEKIAKRKLGCIITWTKKELTMQALDNIPEKYNKIIRAAEQVGQKKMIKGRIAQAGVARGIVKIIRSYHDIKRVQTGDILVANTTHPNYLPAMQKAAAFITNEGGVISHAAIVARELKKPCIVGTGNATKILMDGDLVEVNGDDGIIKIIKTIK